MTTFLEKQIIGKQLSGWQGLGTGGKWGESKNDYKHEGSVFWMLSEVVATEPTRGIQLCRNKYTSTSAYQRNWEDLSNTSGTRHAERPNAILYSFARYCYWGKLSKVCVQSLCVTSCLPAPLQPARAAIFIPSTSRNI